jgi:hypothetical protein
MLRCGPRQTSGSYTQTFDLTLASIYLADPDSKGL